MRDVLCRMSLDGKVTALECWDDRLIQRQIPEQGDPYGLMRTVTCSLVTAPGRPCIDAIPIPAQTNEMGHFQTCLRSLIKAYGDLFRVVSYDAGALSRENGDAVVNSGKDYLFRLRGEQRTMFELADELLETEEVVARTEDVLSSQTSMFSNFGSSRPSRTGEHSSERLVEGERRRVPRAGNLVVRLEPALLRAYSRAVDAPRSIPLGRREQQPPHPRHRLPRGSQALDYRLS